MAKAAAQTGSSPTMIVAIEQYFPEEKRIIKDDLAYRILPSSMKGIVGQMQLDSVRNWMIQTSEKESPGIWGGIMCRKRYIDEKLIDSISQIDAVVNLGAGFDTRSYRLEGLSSIPIWEVDQPETIKTKQKQLLKIFEDIPAHVNFASIDFDHDNLSTILSSLGYSYEKRTFFIWEGVTQYLTNTGIQSIFDFLAKAVCGSRIAFTYVCKDFLDGRNADVWEKGYDDYVRRKIWIFGMEPEIWPSYLKKYGWQIIEDLGYDEMAEKYIKPTGRKLFTSPIERMVYAEKL
ncbi:SAM-dependent methyltransferase [Marasmitruncus massiliensis]|uniref:SAM-dependent methyltransferase n=1 Tax=Marasmitruncus massiliensis TaxID=1944642 RepID=UPI000C79CA4C|nr:SAM-dependent methyltransferase [Marasmitruncus massiliensis]